LKKQLSKEELSLSLEKEQKENFLKLEKLQQVDISVVIPVFNEEWTVLPLYKQLKKILKKTKKSYEIIFVDDGSTDKTTKILSRLYKQNNDIFVIELRRNFGKAAALSAGFRMATGKYIITLDSDLQDDPVEIPRFIKALEQGYDLVSGWKQPRRDPLIKILASKLFNFVTAKLTGIQLHDFNCGFKAYRREVIRELEGSLYGELHRYIPVLAHAKGYRISEIPVNHQARKFGKSKYKLARYSRGFFDLLTVLFLTRYTRRPLHLIGAVGFLFLLLGLLADGYLSVVWLFGGSIGHRPLLILGTLLIIVGVQLISIGLLADLVIQTRWGNNFSEDEYSIRRIMR
jgi:glycosyltransferase involved in cell wall biosynthesis